MNDQREAFYPHRPGMSRIAGFDNLMSIDYRLARERELKAISERDEAMNELDDTVARDRDETRRLLYMATVARRTNRYNLVGTLINALAHHAPPELRVDPDEAAEHLIRAVSDYDNEAGLAWVRERLVEIAARTEDDAE